MDLVSTSIVERENLDIRTSLRHYRRLTNGHSDKAENHAHAFNIYAMVYNVCRPHGTLTASGPGNDVRDGGPRYVGLYRRSCRGRILEGNCGPRIAYNSLYGGERGVVSER